MFDLGETKVAGVKRLRPRVARDNRGMFIKTFHERAFAGEGLTTRFPETYISTSKRNVIRGMHFQLPPHAHAKTVYCIQGHVIDVVLDLRVGSPTFGQFEAFELDGTAPSGLYLPIGCAHGFMSTQPGSLLLYAVETMYEPSVDTGVRWDSFGFDWPVTNPVVSDRDSSLPRLADFQSPFTF